MSLRLTQPGDDLRKAFLALQTRHDVANLLEVDVKRLNYHLHISSPQQRYKSFNIAKRSGSVRRIDAPVSALKILQRKLNQVLQYVYQTKPSVHGFINNKNVITNAATHLRRRYVLNVDLKDFFPSINFGRVRGMFMSRPYNLNVEVATILAQICCHNNQLPQGAPTSPTISNMICAKLDDQLQRLTKKYRCLYTRYADDITISTHLTRFPEKIAYFNEETDKAEIGKVLLGVIEANGFQVNKAKVKLQTKAKRQQVTGITVNKSLNTRRKYINQIRAMLHAWKTYGLDLAEEEFINRYDKKRRAPRKQKVSFARVVEGKIEYLRMVRGSEDALYLRFYEQYCELAGIVNKRQAPLKQDDTPSLPLTGRLITEGKTDWKHLKFALTKLQSEGLFLNLQVHFHEYDDDMPAGGPEIKDMCSKTARFKQDMAHIFIFDRDDSTVLKGVTEKDLPYKSWGNNVFSFSIPVPEHRRETPDLCIEMYYKDEEITRFDKNNRRLFLSNEFRKSGRHKSGNGLLCLDRNKIKDEKRLTIIDDQVSNEAEENVALTKSAFVKYICDQEENFDNFDHSTFSLIFKVIEQILSETMKR